MLYPILLLPAALLAWLYWCHVRPRTPWRTAAVVLLVALFGYPYPRQRTAGLDLVIVADRSRSITPDRRANQEEILRLVGRNLAPEDRMTVVSFNRAAHLEALITRGQSFSSFQTPFSEDASSLDEGLKLGIEVADFARNVRVLVLSDGEYTGLDPRGRARRLAERGAEVHFRQLETPVFFDVAVRDGRAPGRVVEGEPFQLSFEVYASEANRAVYRVLRNGRPLRSRSADKDGWRSGRLEAGYNSLTFADLPPEAGTYRYTIEVATDHTPPEVMTDNNQGETFVHVVGEDRVLVVNAAGGPDNVTNILSAAGIPTGAVAIGAFNLDLFMMRGYKAIVLNGVSIASMPYARIVDLQRFVEQEGGGLLVTGGPKSFASGGYYKSPLQDVLPVSMEVQQIRQKTSLALSIVLDRSGSMSMPVPSGEQKIDLANTAAAASVDLLSPNDSISVLAVDSLAHVIIAQRPVDDPAGIASTIKTIESMGGGIFVYTGLVAAGSEVTDAAQVNKHILLFSDAMDSEEPGDYRQLLADFADAGITVSVVGLGTEQDIDAEFLKDVAARGGGDIYFTQDAHQLPQIFSLDTMTRTRQTFQREPTTWSITPLADVLASDQQWSNFSSGDFNLLYVRPEADTAILSEDEERAPGLAFWQRGAGRAAALSFDTSGEFARQPMMAGLVLDTVRWTMASDVRDEANLKTRRVGSRAVATLELSEKTRQQFTAAELRVFAPDGSERRLPMRWTSHNKLEVDFPLDEAGAFRGLVDLGGEQLRMEPVALPGSPEFLYDFPPGYGRETLEEIARLGGGREVLDLRELFVRRAEARGRRPFVYPLVAAVLLLLLLDVAEQRFAMIPATRRRVAAWRARWAARRHARAAKTAEVAGGTAVREEARGAQDAASVMVSRKERRKAAAAARAIDDSAAERAAEKEAAGAAAAVAVAKRAKAAAAAVAAEKAAEGSTGSALKSAKERARRTLGG